MAGKGISGIRNTMDKAMGAGKHWLSTGIVVQENQRTGPQDRVGEGAEDGERAVGYSQIIGGLNATQGFCILFYK